MVAPFMGAENPTVLLWLRISCEVAVTMATSVVGLMGLPPRGLTNIHGEFMLAVGRRHWFPSTSRRLLGHP